MLDAPLAAPVTYRPMPLSISAAVRAGRAGVFALAVLSLASCAKAPLIGHKSTLHIVLTAEGTCNSCGQVTGYPLTYRVVQVKDASALTGTTLTQVWDKEEKLLGSAFISKTEAYIDPGQSRELPLKLEKDATAVVVIGNFCKAKGSCWYFVQPLASGGTVKLTAGTGCFTATK